MVLDTKNHGTTDCRHLLLTVCSQIEEWRILAWQGMDLRIVMQDITSRMANEERTKPSVLTLRETRFREPNRLGSLA